MPAAMGGLVCVGALYVFFLHAPGLYGGFDGVLTKHLVIERLRWLTPFQLNALNPYQGVANLWFMTSAWLNPGYAVFALLPDLRYALPASYALFALIYAAATSLFARTLVPALSRTGAWSIAFAASLAVLPPFARIVGVYPTFEFAPGGAYYVALYLVLLALLLRIGEGTAARQVVLALALGALVLFGIACDPMWMPMLFLSVAPFGLAALAADWSWRRALIRALACLAILAVFYVLGVMDYLAGVAGYTSRLFFWRESAGMHRETTFVFFGLQNSRGFWLAVLLGLGFVFAAMHGPTRVRVMALACVACMTALAAYSVAYLALRAPWPYPLPLYLEIMALPVFFVVAALGWCALVGRWLPARAAPWSVPLGLVLLAGWSVVKFGANGRPELALFTGRTSPIPIVQTLIAETALDPGAHFRGTTAAPYGVFALYGAYRDALGHGLYFPDLWAQRVPTFHEYSQLATPAMYYVASRLVGAPPFDAHNITPFPTTTPKALDALRALGVRFLLSERDVEVHGARRAQWSGSGLGAFLYELPDPNLGDYSPTQVRARVRARDVLAELRRPDFDFHRDVVLERAPDTPLVAARSARLIFEKGGARVVAQSEASSLLLLPIQFSHCLAFEGRSDATLVRANFVQAAVIFRRALDARLDFRFSPFTQPGCRKADLDDMQRAELHSEVRPREPDWTTHAPWSHHTVRSIVKNRLAQLVLGL